MAEPLPGCACGSSDQVAWAAAFDAWLCFTCRTRCTWQALGDWPPGSGAGPQPAPAREVPACNCDWPPGNPFAMHHAWCDRLAFLRGLTAR